MRKCGELQNMSFLWSFHLDALRYLLPEAFSFTLIALRVHRDWPLQITGDISTFLPLKHCWLIFISPTVSNKLIPQALMYHIYVAHACVCMKSVMCAFEVSGTSWQVLICEQHVHYRFWLRPGWGLLILRCIIIRGNCSVSVLWQWRTPLYNCHWKKSSPHDKGSMSKFMHLSQTNQHLGSD